MSKIKNKVTYDRDDSFDIVDYEKHPVMLTRVNLKNEIEIEPVKEIIAIQKRHFKKGEFYMQNFAFDKLVLDKKYNSVDLRLIVALKEKLDFNNRISNFTQKEIAERVGSTQPKISRALKKLEEDEVIFKDGLDYYFNDSYIKGAGNKGKKQKDDYENPRFV
jgi:hypothetical protein